MSTYCKWFYCIVTTKTTTVVEANNQSKMRLSTSNDSKPDNYQINAKICRLVERYPCMYDRSHPHYLKKDVVDKAWVKISKEMDDSSKYEKNLAICMQTRISANKRKRVCVCEQTVANYNNRKHNTLAWRSLAAPCRAKTFSAYLQLSWRVVSPCCWLTTFACCCCGHCFFMSLHKHCLVWQSADCQTVSVSIARTLLPIL